MLHLEDHQFSIQGIGHTLSHELSLYAHAPTILLA